MVVVFVFGARREAMIGGIGLQKQIYADNKPQNKEDTDFHYFYPTSISTLNLVSSFQDWYVNKSYAQ